MIADPFFLDQIVRANSHIAAAMEQLQASDPQYGKKHKTLASIQKRLETFIIAEVTAD